MSPLAVEGRFAPRRLAPAAIRPAQIDGGAAARRPAAPQAGEETVNLASLEHLPNGEVSGWIDAPAEAPDMDARPACNAGVRPPSSSEREAEVIELKKVFARYHPVSPPMPRPARELVARIYRPAPSATQGRGRRKAGWVLEFEPRSAPATDPLTGWTGSSDTLQQVRLAFPSRERAVAFAKRQGWAYDVVEPCQPKRRPRYANSSRYEPATAQAAFTG